MSGGHVPTVTAPTDPAAGPHRPRRTIAAAMSEPTRPFRFLAAFQAVVDAPALIETARRAEATGYAAVVIPDHLIEQLSPVVAMTAIAAATTTLRVGTFVLNNDLRHPAVLAQDLASIDVLSGGRLDIGIGAGWNQPEYEAIGLPFDAGRPARRPPRRGGGRPQGLLRRRPVHVPRRALRGHRLRRAAQAAPAAPPAAPHRRRRSPDARPSPRGRRTSSAWPRGSCRGPKSDPHSLTVAATEEKIGWVREAAGDRFDRARAQHLPVDLAGDDHRSRPGRGRPRHRSPARAHRRRADLRRGPRIAAPVHRLDRRPRREAGRAARATRDQLGHARRGRRARARSWSASPGGDRRPPPRDAAERPPKTRDERPWRASAIPAILWA